MAPKLSTDIIKSDKTIIQDTAYQFWSNSENLITVIKELTIALILCDRLHALLSTQSLLVAMLHSSHGGSGIGLNDGLFVEL